MSVYLVGAVNIADKDEYRKYSIGAAAAIAAFNAQVLSNDDNPVIVEGSQPAGHLFIVKFKSMDDFNAFYASEAYQSVLHYRTKSSETVYIMAMRSFELPDN